MARRIYSPWFLALGLLLSPTLRSQSDLPQGVAELEAYKRRLEQLQRHSDPARKAQLARMRLLLSLMQRSILIQDENVKAAPISPTEPPDAHPPAPPPLPPSEDLPPTRTLPAQDDPADPALPPRQVPSPKESTSPAPDPTPQPMPPLIEQAPAVKIPDWFFRAQVTTAVGYQENLLRSAFSDVDSALLHGALDLQLLNRRRKPHRVVVLGRYTRTHFLEEPSVEDEDLLFLLGQVDYQFRDHWWLGLSASHFSARQPFDDPDFVDLDGASAPLRFRQSSLAPQITWKPDGGHTWLFSGGYRQEDTEGLLPESQDNDQRFLSLGYTFEPRKTRRWRLDYQYTHANYDQRTARQPSGAPLADALQLTTHEWRADYRQTWGTDDLRWRAEARLRLQLEKDHAGGYDQVARLETRGRIGLRYHRQTDLRAELRYGHSFYDRRQVSFRDPRRRVRSYWAGALSLEHRLSRRTSLWSTYEFRESSGNRDIDHYGAHLLYTGVRLTF